MTPENITALADNQIFVFGSNLNGNHAGGAAKLAKDKFGAEEGIGFGATGQCYAFPTLGYKMEKLSPEFLKENAEELKQYAKQNPQLVFFLTRVGLGIAGYSVEEIEPLFKDAPANIIQPKW